MKIPSFDIKGPLHRLRHDPFLDWLLILVIAAAIIIVLAAVGASVYLDVGDQLTAPVVAHSGKLAALDDKALQSALHAFDQRAALWQSIVSGGYAAPKDPSLP